MQPLLYPTHTLLGPNVNVLGPYSGAAGTSLSPAAAAAAISNSAHYSNQAAAAAAAYDFANQYNQGQIDAATAAAAAAAAASFPYNTAGNNSSAASLAALSNPNVANYAYAALAQQALPSLTAAYQQ